MLSVILLIIVVIGLCWYIALSLEYLSNMRPGRVVYHGSDLHEQGPILEDIINRYVPSTNRYTLIEPGAGLGKVAEFLARLFSWERVEAIEVAPLILLEGRLRGWLRRSPVTFIKKDIFTYPFPSPAVIYCYLTTEMLDRLYLQGQFQGSLVITLTFRIPSVKAVEEIPLKGWQKRILVYDFR